MDGTGTEVVDSGIEGVADTGIEGVDGSGAEVTDPGVDV